MNPETELDRGQDWEVVPQAYVNPAHTPEQLQPTNSPLQASGATLTGTVSDATGAVIPGASVTASAPSGRFAGTAVTGRDGRYAVNGLDPGIYDLKTRAPALPATAYPGNQRGALAAERDEHRARGGNGKRIRGS